MKSPLITVKSLSISYHQAPSAKPLQPYHYFPAEGQGGTATKSWRRRVLNGCAPPVTPGKGTLRSSWFRSLEVSVVRGLWSTNLIYDIYIHTYTHTHTHTYVYIYYIYMIIYIYIYLYCIYIYILHIISFIWVHEPTYNFGRPFLPLQIEFSAAGAHRFQIFPSLVVSEGGAEMSHPSTRLAVQFVSFFWGLWGGTFPDFFSFCFRLRGWELVDWWDRRCTLTYPNLFQVRLTGFPRKPIPPRVRISSQLARSQGPADGDNGPFEPLVL